MSAIKRMSVDWKDEYMIDQLEVQLGDYNHEPSEDSRSGKEFCTIEGVRYWRHDCYAPFSPYGWARVDAAPLH